MGGVFYLVVIIRGFVAKNIIAEKKRKGELRQAQLDKLYNLCAKKSATKNYDCTITTCSSFINSLFLNRSIMFAVVTTSFWQ